jgi:hypothetical protein
LNYFTLKGKYAVDYRDKTRSSIELKKLKKLSREGSKAFEIEVNKVVQKLRLPNCELGNCDLQIIILIL